MKSSDDNSIARLQQFQLGVLAPIYTGSQGIEERRVGVRQLQLDVLNLRCEQNKTRPKN